MNPIDQVRNALAEHGRPYWVAYVPMPVVRQVPYATLVELMAEAPVNNKGLKERAMLAWANQNHDTLITTAEVADMMGVSHPTAKKFLQAHADIFMFVKRGTYKAVAR